jgi:hypothetical protein
MKEIPENVKSLLFGFGPSLHAIMAIIANLLGIVCLVLGVASTVMKTALGLDGSSWLLLTIILFLWNLSFWFSAYFGAKEGYVK